MDCVIMKDKTTNQSRGFGFVKFKDPNCVGTVLASRPHTLDGRNVSVLPLAELSLCLGTCPSFSFPLPLSFVGSLCGKMFPLRLSEKD